MPALLTSTSIGAELGYRRRDHLVDGFSFRYVGRSGTDVHREFLCQPRTQPFDFSGPAEAVQHHIHALGAKRTGNAEADTAG